MRAPRAATLCLLTLFVLAGCTGTGDPAATSDATGTGAASTSSTTGPLGTGTSNGTLGGPGSGTAVDPKPLAVRPITFDGTVGPGACVPSGPNSCMSTPPATDTASKTFDEPRVATWRIDVNLTWSAAQPTTATLLFAILPYATCGSGCVGSTGTGLDVTGTSPLRLQGTITAPADSDGIWVLARVPQTSTPAGYAEANVPQDIHVSGTAWAYA